MVGRERLVLEFEFLFLLLSRDQSIQDALLEGDVTHIQIINQLSLALILQALHFGSEVPSELASDRRERIGGRASNTEHSLIRLRCTLHLHHLHRVLLLSGILSFKFELGGH